MNITLVQTSLFWENAEKNLSHFDKLISEISDTDIILLPEMFNTAFCPQSNHLAENMDGKTVRWMKKIAKTKGCAIAGTSTSLGFAASQTGLNLAYPKDKCWND